VQHVTRIVAELTCPLLDRVTADEFPIVEEVILTLDAERLNGCAGVGACRGRHVSISDVGPFGLRYSGRSDRLLRRFPFRRLIDQRLKLFPRVAGFLPIGKGVVRTARSDHGNRANSFR